MSLSWGAYVALSVAILIFLVHDELETFSATSDTMQLVWTDVVSNDTTGHADTTEGSEETVLINVLARQLFVPAFKEASQKLQGRTASRSNMTGNCFLTLLEDQFVLTVVHPAQPLGPQHDASRGVVERYTRPGAGSLENPSTEDWELAWTDELPGKVIRAFEEPLSGAVVVMYTVMSRQSAQIHFKHYSATQTPAPVGSTIPGSLSISMAALHTADQSDQWPWLMYAHELGFNKFHVALPVPRSRWQMLASRGPRECGDETVCIADGPAADRRPSLSRTIVLAPFTKNAIADAVLSVELQSHPRSTSANRLLVQLHSANNSAESRCKCDVADLTNTTTVADLEATLGGESTRSASRARSSFVQSADHDVVVIAVADLVLTVQRNAETGAVNVTQLLAREISRPVKLMKMSPDGETFFVSLTDHSMMLLWRGDPTEPVGAEIDPITMMAYGAMMLEPDLPYDPLAGAPWNHMAHIHPPTELQQRAVTAATLVPSSNQTFVVVVFEGGLLSVFRTKKQPLDVDDESLFFSSLLPIVTLGTGILIFGVNALEMVAPHPFLEA